MYSTKKCPSCNHAAETEFEACPKCGLIIKRYVEKITEKAKLDHTQKEDTQRKVQHETKWTNVNDVEDKYPALGIILILAKVTAILPILFSLVVLFFPSSTGVPFLQATAIKCLLIIISVIWGVMVWAGAESVEIFIDMERNQRKILKALSQT